MGCINNNDMVIGRGLLRDVGEVWQIFLRLECIGTQVRAFCRADGEHWWIAGEVEFPVQGNVQVGMHAIGEIDRSIYQGAYTDETAIRFTTFEMWRL